ncbi:unnamed protein product [Nezara viridula]|uniref:Uncharacterized protein n=1 Tax=Nezara viridula TaxID=85310 RepID=A0A9P0GZG5_NEZVI|nr:unnamed protein product [Nezara viridula]
MRKKGRPPTDWDKEMKKTCGETAWKRVALETKEWKRMRQVHCLDIKSSAPSKVKRNPEIAIQSLRDITGVWSIECPHPSGKRAAGTVHGYQRTKGAVQHYLDTEGVPY